MPITSAVGNFESLNADTAEAVYAWLAERHPSAPVAAVGGDGLTVPWPASLAVGDHSILKGRSALDFVEPSDHVAVVAAWERVGVTGGTRVRVHLVSGNDAELHFLDLRRDHGVFVAFFAPADGADHGGGNVLAGHDDRSSVPPRVCRLTRDQVAQVAEVDERTVEILGWAPEDIVGRRSIELVHPDDVERAIANWMEMLAEPGLPHRWRGRYQKADGSYLWLDITNTNRLDDPRHHDVVSEMVDISDEMAMHEALRERERLLRRLTEALPSGILEFDASRRTLHVNEQLVALVGDGTLEALAGAVVEGDRRPLEAALSALLAVGADADLEVRLTGDRICRVALRALTDDAGVVTGGIACVDDVTEEARLRHELEVRATFDDLTSCFTRAAILGGLRDAADRQPGTGVVFIDLDRFKAVNDAYGHAAGDELLGVIGERLRAAVREVDLVGRLGGDEFLVVCPGVPDAAAVDAIAARVADAIAQPLVLQGEHVVCPQASLGTAWAPAGGDPDVLVARADAAMYAEKRPA